MSVIEAVTVTLYRVANRPKGWRKGKPRRQKALAYRDAAWAKMRARCGCVGDGPERIACRYHDKEFRAEDIPGSYEVPDAHGFIPPLEWGLPRREDVGYWDYGRAVAFRLARFYAYLDARAKPAGSPDTNPERK